MERFKHNIFMLAEKEGITRVQFFAMHAIYRQDELAMGQIADALSCDASNVTGIVDRLVAQDLVIRQESPKDRRTKTLRLTTKGHQIMERIEAALPERIGCEKLAEKELVSLKRIVQKVCS